MDQIPAKPIKLTPPQADMLRRVVATNGGGISVYKLIGQERRVVMRLHEMGLVQGKSGILSTAVHTKDGLAWVRSNRDSPTDNSTSRDIPRYHV